MAIKIIDFEESEDEIEEIRQEIIILAELESLHVTRYHSSFTHESSLWIVMEYCSGGSCQDILKTSTFNEGQVAVVMRQLLLGLEYVHGLGKIHRDIKAANILLTMDGHVKLADFGK